VRRIFGGTVSVFSFLSTFWYGMLTALSHALVRYIELVGYLAQGSALASQLVDSGLAVKWLVLRDKYPLASRLIGCNSQKPIAHLLDYFRGQFAFDCAD